MSTGLIADVNENSAEVSQITSATLKSSSGMGGWDAEKFAREQIRGLVRRIFLQKIRTPVRQVIFSTAGAGVEVDELCRQVGRILAEEQPGDVALIQQHLIAAAGQPCLPLKENAIRLESNLWYLQGREGGEHRGAVLGLYAALAAARAEFEYSIIVGVPAEDPNPLVQAAQFSDGLVLVLSVHTRRAAALYTKQVLDQTRVRVLGTVLTDREFPIPQCLYRHL